MPDILLSSTSSDSRSALNDCNLSGSTGLYDRNCQPSSQVRAYNPYLVSDELTIQNQTILGQLMASGAPRMLTEMNQCFGADQVSDLAEFREHGAALGIGSIGTSASVYTDRTNAFVKAIERYQKALLSYRDAVQEGSRFQVARQIEARRAFDRLQTEFQSEMKILTSRSNARRGTPLTRSERGINIARSSRHADKLYVANQAQAHNLVGFTRYAKVLGNGLAVIDFGGRVGKIHTSHLAGDNWHREMFVQSSSFAASALASVGAVKGGLVLMAAFTPLGLVGLIVGGAAIAAGAAGAAVATNYYFEENSGSWYDDIMEWLAGL